MSKQPLRVLQLIDSLDAGGSERMAVQLANLLSSRIELSALISTRKTGILEKDINQSVVFTCLNRKKRLDISAIFQLKSFIKKNHIQVIHAHSTSFFIACIVKCLMPSIKIIWHDHYGFRYKTKKRNNLALIASSVLFSQIICINNKLSDWAKSNLLCKNVNTIENFSIKPKQNTSKNVRLKGKKGEFKVIHVANLRPEKDHLTALKSVNLLINNGFKISYHSIGAIDKTSKYYLQLKEFVGINNLQDRVFFYGTQSGIYSYLNQADLGILSSLSEGFPVSLIEYGFAKLPVVVTDVGDCSKIVSSYGKVVKKGNHKDLAIAIEENIIDREWSLQQASKFHNKVNKMYNHQAIIQKILDIYNAIK